MCVSLYVCFCFASVRKLLEGEETHFNSGMSFGTASYSYQARSSTESYKSSQREKGGAMKESFKGISEDKEEADINSNNWTQAGEKLHPIMSIKAVT